MILVAVMPGIMRIYSNLLCTKSQMELKFTIIFIKLLQRMCTSQAVNVSLIKMHVGKNNTLIKKYIHTG